MKDTDIIDSHPGNISLAGRPDSLKNSLVGNFKYAGVPAPMYSGTSPEPNTPAPPPPDVPALPAWNGNTYSLDFDGTSDYMDIPDSTALETTAFTWSAWLYCTAIDRHNPVVDASRHAGLFQSYHIRVNSDNKIRFASYHANDALDSTTVVSADRWYHVVATHESGSDKLYVNGSLEASGSASNFSITDAANLRIGSSSLFGMYHQGLIDEVSFFNSALSASDVSSIYNRGAPGDISSLNPVGWWRMGDNDGGTGTTITDQGSGGNNATLTNGPTYSTHVPYILTSITNTYSVEFDGTNDHINLGNDSSLSISGALSITAWIYADSLSGFPMIVSKRASLSSHAYQFYSTSNKLNYNNGTIVQSTGTISTGAWTHVGVTFDGSGGVSFYINGSSAGTATAASSNPTNSANVTIANAFNGNHFNGKIDELAIFNSVLSSSHINRIYNSGVPNDISSLNPVGWWRMGDNDGGTGTTVTDQGSGGNDGTLINGPTFLTDAPKGNKYSIAFDGTNDFMSIPDADVFSLGNGLGTDNAFSISSWFNADNIHTNYIATKDASGDREWAFRTVVNQLHFFAFGTGGGYIGRKYTTDLSGGQWYNAVATYDGSKASSGIKIYLNGSRVDDADYAAGTYTAANNTGTEVRVAALQINSTHTAGKVDELSFFNTELSASDVTAIYNSGVPNNIFSLNPVAWYRMGDGTEAGSGTTVFDMSINSHNGALINGPTFLTDVP